MTGARAAAPRLLAALLAVVVAGGCADFGDPTGEVTSVTRSQPVLELGDDTRTASGNVVRVHDFEFPAEGADDGVAAALVEACAGATAAENTGASPAFFRLELADRRGLTPGRPVREPALSAVRLKRGDCVEGWVSFALGRDDVPQFMVFRGSSVVKWRLST